MIAKALFFVLLLLSATFLLRGLRRKEGILQFPVLFAGAFTFSIVPQMINHVFYPGLLPGRVYQDHGVEYGLIMCILCLVAGIGGCQGRPRAVSRPMKPITIVNVEQLFWAGTVLYAVGAFGALRLAALAGGLKAQFTEGGHYGLEWHGAPVLWIYVTKLLPLGLILCLNSTLIRGNPWKWVLTCLMMLYPLAVVVFLGRRSMVFNLSLIVLVSLWFQRRWAPPQWASLGGMVAAGLVIVLAPHYRMYANQTGDVKGAIMQIDVSSAMAAYATGDQAEGMTNLIMGIPARLSELSFSWGTGFWNGIVDYWVPGQLIGYQVKEKLTSHIGKADDDVFSGYCGSVSEYGSFSTGPYSVFREFAFLGCTLFFLIGRFYRWLWQLAERCHNPITQALYASCAVLVPVAVVDSVVTAFAVFLLPLGVLVLLWTLCTRRRRMFEGFCPTWSSRFHTRRPPNRWTRHGFAK